MLASPLRRDLHARRSFVAQMPPTRDEIEEHRDRRWRREESRRVDTAYEAERFVEDVGFVACLTDSRRPGPSLYIAVCGRRDAVLPQRPEG